MRYKDILKEVLICDGCRLYCKNSFIYSHEYDCLYEDECVENDHKFFKIDKDKVYREYNLEEFKIIKL